MICANPELLIPAGSPEKLRYAVAYGADAVYLGLPMASLRTPSRGEQFTPQNLESHLRYAQERGVKAYVTINIFPGNGDLKRVIPHLEQLETLRPDAIIFSDPGVFRLARRYAPSIPLHLSTQANTLNVEACAFWQDLGLERVILAREVPVREMAQIHERLPNLELEAFVHGSLCVAYSGRCMISDYLTDNTKNSNKGMCGNSCRWEFSAEGGSGGCGCSTEDDTSPITEDAFAAYRDAESGLLTMTRSEVSRPHEAYTFEEDDKGSYMLNSRDLCLVRRLRELQEAGICSFKVEGRTKSVYYAATTARIYREAIDWFSGHPTSSDDQLTAWVAELSAAGNRGFTEGFFDGRPHRDAYNYQDSRSHQTTQFLGTVSEIASPTVGRLAFQARNPIRVGDRVDWLLPGRSIAFTIRDLQDERGFPIQAAQTNQIANLPLPEGISTEDVSLLNWSILRSSLPLAGVGPSTELKETAVLAS
jgi:putative protease